MASMCSRCAVRLQRANNAAHMTSRRAFSQTTTAPKELPTFIETSNEELNNVLSSLRTKYIVPDYLRKKERKLIFSPKFKQYIEENPQKAQIGEEEIELQWIDRMARPRRQKLVDQALRMILHSSDKSWDNLPRLLRAMNEGAKRPLSDHQFEFIVRKAVHQGKLSVVFRCLQQSQTTGLTLKNWRVLRAVVYGIRETAQKSGWEKNHVANALEDFNKVMFLLESEEHGGGRALQSDDARRRPEILGTLLELSAVYAHKHAGGQDINGMVKTYADRLLSALKASEENLATESKIILEDPETSTRQHWHFLLAVPVYHGLSLASRILDNKMPRSDAATQIISQYHARLESLASELEARKPEKDTYDAQALAAWKRCIRE